MEYIGHTLDPDGPYPNLARLLKHTRPGARGIPSPPYQPRPGRLERFRDLDTFKKDVDKIRDYEGTHPAPESLSAAVHQELKQRLTPVQYTRFARWWGLDSPALSPPDIADEDGVTRQAAWQVLDRACERLWEARKGGGLLLLHLLTCRAAPLPEPLSVYQQMQTEDTDRGVADGFRRNVATETDDGGWRTPTRYVDDPRATEMVVDSDDDNASGSIETDTRMPQGPKYLHDVGCTSEDVPLNPQHSAFADGWLAASEGGRNRYNRIRDPDLHRAWAEGYAGARVQQAREQGQKDARRDRSEPDLQRRHEIAPFNVYDLESDPDRFAGWHEGYHKEDARLALEEAQEDFADHIDGASSVRS